MSLLRYPGGLNGRRRLRGERLQGDPRGLCTSPRSLRSPSPSGSFPTPGSPLPRYPSPEVRGAETRRGAPHRVFPAPRDRYLRPSRCNTRTCGHPAKIYTYISFLFLMHFLFISHLFLHPLPPPPPLLPPHTRTPNGLISICIISKRRSSGRNTDRRAGGPPHPPPHPSPRCGSPALGAARLSHGQRYRGAIAPSPGAR